MTVDEAIFVNIILFFCW